jgi:WXXGXW repeat (2 copies)
MNQRKSLLAASVFGLVIAAALPACVVVPDQGHYAGGVVMVAPPDPRVEVVGVVPAGYVWAGGYWNWIGGRHVWVAGHWVPARYGYHWVGHAWVRTGDGWRMRPGHWERG